MKKYIILIVAILGLLLISSQSCLNSEKPNTETVEADFVEVDSDDEDGEEETLTEKGLQTEMGDDEGIGSTDFNFLEAWSKFDSMQFQNAVDYLGFVPEYVEGEGEDLEKYAEAHLLITIGKIEELIELLEAAEKKDSPEISKKFTTLGLNLVKVYLDIAESMGESESPADYEYYISKSIELMNKISSNVVNDEKEIVIKLLQDFNELEMSIDEATGKEEELLKKLNDNTTNFLVNQNKYFKSTPSI